MSPANRPCSGDVTLLLDAVKGTAAVVCRMLWLTTSFRFPLDMALGRCSLSSATCFRSG